VAAIAELDADRLVEGTYAVARKERLRTRGGAPYLALELVDPSGRIDARVWSDVDLLAAINGFVSSGVLGTYTSHEPAFPFPDQGCGGDTTGGGRG